MTQLSEHFTLEEFVRTSTGLPNEPGEAQVANLRRLAETGLEPLRAVWGVPIKVNSGFRSLAVNKRVGGANNSAHLKGNAADIIPVGLDLSRAFETARLSPIPFDQLILEEMPNGSRWIHFSMGTGRPGQPRRMALRAFGDHGIMRYRRVSEG